MIYAPETQQGSFFNDQEREVKACNGSKRCRHVDEWRGEHCSSSVLISRIRGYNGTSASRPIESSRLDGLARRATVFGAPTATGRQRNRSRRVHAGSLASRFAPDDGARVPDRQGSGMEQVNWSPRAGMSIGVLPEGRGILRGGVGRFRQRTPLNVGAFSSFESRTVTRFDLSGR